MNGSSEELNMRKQQECQKTKKWITKRIFSTIIMMFVPYNKSDIQDIVNKAGEVENVRMMTADWVSQLIGEDNCKTWEMSEQLDTDKGNHSKSDMVVKAKKLWLKFGEVWDMALFK